MKRTTLYLPEELDLLLSQLAQREGRSKAEPIREALERFAEARREEVLPSWVGVGESADPGYIDRDEEELLPLAERHRVRRALTLDRGHFLRFRPRGWEYLEVWP
ncbi:CopG family transcriptional regulator [Thermus thermamylovorans]|uniref:Ribbon-helix-helix protein, CopG family n=1 Tax=Thermus thermamylovorans TaxID=2509362 RepID=A0A4Q9AXP0_9DEIN|nr:CopG family transcriptional regulator [Thermus thermamylovorans]TBH15911.1 ribbon-helix-helix protein, CopG family [Thermus thermamylovorans]